MNSSYKNVQHSVSQALDVSSLFQLLLDYSKSIVELMFFKQLF